MNRRSHPPALLKLAEKALKGECKVQPGDGIVVAVSGGADSTALVHSLSLLATGGRLRLHAHGVDHGLRPAAGNELDIVESHCARWGVEFSRSVLCVAAGGNLQARAREARYGALEAVRQRVGAHWIATAHHADDRAETVLLRLLRGTGTSGLAVLPPVDGSRVRPLVRATRADVLSHLERHGISWSEDPSNLSSRFLRSRVRHELLPLLEGMSPGIVRHLNNLADDVCSQPEGGTLPTLGRAHTQQLSEILRLGRVGGQVRLGAGKVLRLDREATGMDRKN